jgi:hypothetical protein
MWAMNDEAGQLISKITEFLEGVGLPVERHFCQALKYGTAC